MQWVVYILRCADDSLYTGVTNNLERRLQKHHDGTGAKYTRGRGPFELIFSEEHSDRSSASKREAEIKKFSKEEKQSLENIGRRPGSRRSGC